MAKHIYLLIAIILTFAFAGCTEKERAKRYGGSFTVKLECGQKLFTITWKEDSLWYATRPMRPDETAETYTFSEDSAWGAFEGKVTLVECDK